MSFTIYDLAKKDYELSNAATNQDSHIISFKESFRQSVNKCLKTLPENVNQKEVRTLMANNIKLKQETENKPFIDSSGKTDSTFETAILSLTQIDLVKRHPDLEIHNTKSVVNEPKNSELQIEENKKENFNKLFEEYYKLENKEDKINFIKRNICYNWDEISEDAQEVIFNSTETYSDYKLFEQKYAEEHMEYTDEEIKKFYLTEKTDTNEKDLDDTLQFVENYRILTNYKNKFEITNDPNLKSKINNLEEAVNQYLKEHSITKEDANNMITKQTEKNSQDITEFLENNTNSGKEIENAEIISDTSEEFSLDDILGGNIPEQENNISSEETLFDDMFNPEETESLDLEDFFTDIDISQEEPSSDFLPITESLKENNSSNKIVDDNNTIVQIPNLAKNTYINPIMAGVQLQNEELSQTEYVQEIKENPLQKLINNIRARFSNNIKTLNEGQATQMTTNKQGFFSRLKNSISKFMNSNQPLAIDTAENNTKTTYEKTTSIFDQSLLVSNEELAKNKAIYEATKSHHKTKSNSVIEVDNRAST